MHENKGFCRDGRWDGLDPGGICIACIEDWLSEELEFEMEGITNARCND